MSAGLPALQAASAGTGKQAGWQDGRRGGPRAPGRPARRSATAGGGRGVEQTGPRVILGQGRGGKGRPAPCAPGTAAGASTRAWRRRTRRSPGRPACAPAAASAPPPAPPATRVRARSLAPRPPPPPRQRAAPTTGSSAAGTARVTQAGRRRTELGAARTVVRAAPAAGAQRAGWAGPLARSAGGADAPGRPCWRRR